MQPTITEYVALGLLLVVSLVAKVLWEERWAVRCWLAAWLASGPSALVLVESRGLPVWAFRPRPRFGVVGRLLVAVLRP